MFAFLAPISGGELLAVCVLLWFAICGGFVFGAAWGFNAHRSKLADMLTVMSHKDRVFVVDALERAKATVDEKGEIA